MYRFIIFVALAKKIVAKLSMFYVCSTNPNTLSGPMGQVHPMTPQKWTSPCSFFLFSNWRSAPVSSPRKRAINGVGDVAIISRTGGAARSGCHWRWYIYVCIHAFKLLICVLLQNHTRDVAGFGVFDTSLFFSDYMSSKFMANSYEFCWESTLEMLQFF
jgi:hypothetical protein